MSEYWKSAERYWCKHCQVFIRDTPLERRNHEATGRHQGNLKRFLRDIHRNHEREEREKARAQREIDRLNGVKPSTVPGGVGSSSAAAGRHSESSLARQREQLAAMGVVMPGSGEEEEKSEVAAPGAWTVTSTRVVETNSDREEKVDGKALGVRKREVTEEEREEEAAVEGLFKRQKRWGRDSKVIGGGEDAGLDALLSGSIQTRVKRDGDEHDGGVKKEEGEEEVLAKSENDSADTVVKEEPNDAAGGLDDSTKDMPTTETTAGVKAEEAEPAAGAVVFKKRKTKQLRQK